MNETWKEHKLTRAEFDQLYKDVWETVCLMNLPTTESKQILEDFHELRLAQGPLIETQHYLYMIGELYGASSHWK